MTQSVWKWNGDKSFWNEQVAILDRKKQKTISELVFWLGQFRVVNIIVLSSTNKLYYSWEMWECEMLWTENNIIKGKLY